MGMSVQKAWAVPTLESRAAAYNMPYARVDGMDVLAVRETAHKAAEHVRSGKGPMLVESVTYRFRGHSMADPAYYRTREEEKAWRTGKDPIALFEEKLKEAGILTDEQIAANNARADEIVTAADKFANESPDPSLDELYDNVSIANNGAIAWRTKPSSPRE
jgi:pyruvate dehydrogenase E1 component alpha subunit